MSERVKWYRVVFIIGVAATVIGAIDPMEGSVVIAMASICLALSTYYMRDRYAKIFIVAAIMVVFSVAALWYVSSLGGFDPKKEWWWTVILIPYPVGWLISIITLIVRWVKREDRLETGD